MLGVGQIFEGGLNKEEELIKSFLLLRGFIGHGGLIEKGLKIKITVVYERLFPLFHATVII